MAFGNAVTGTAFGVLNEILGLVRGTDGVAKQTRYEVILIPPTGARGTNTTPSNAFASQMSDLTGDGTARATSLKCEQISMPGRNIDTAPDNNIYGPVREIAQGWSFADITAQFQLSSDLKERRFFETWQRLSFNPDTWNMGYYDDYTGTIQIFQLDEQDNRRYGVELIECFPKTVGELTYDYSAVNTQQKVQITFSYRYWKNLTDESKLPRSLQERLQTLLLNTVERQLTSRIPAVIRNL
tara:strand:+ start:417 stop:1139 length:723 start_codon:yes stop_codon:yes gene_type:complete